MRVLNWFRYVLELWCQRLLLEILYRRQYGTKDGDVPLVMYRSQFRSDVVEEDRAYITGVLTRTKRPVYPETLGVVVTAEDIEVVSKPSVKSFIQGLAEPPKSMDSLVATYGHNGNPRAAKTEVHYDEFSVVGLSDIPRSGGIMPGADIPKNADVKPFVSITDLKKKGS